MTIAVQARPTKEQLDKALADAVRLGNVERSGQLICEWGADAHAALNGRPMITLAAKLKKPGMISLLLKAGADPNACSPEGESAAEIATRNFNANSLRLLLKAGADPSRRNAAKETVGDIISSGLKTALAAEAAQKYNRHIQKAETDKWRSLAIAQALDPNAVFEGQPVITLAARMTDPAALKDLISEGADLDATNRDGDCALLLAARDMNPAFAKLLMDAGANPHQPDARGVTALGIILAAALKSAEEETTEPSYRREDIRKKTAEAAAFALAIACHPSYTAAGDAPNSALPLAARLQDSAVFEALLDKGVPVNATTKDGDCALHMAAVAGRQDMAELLLQKGASVLQLNKDRQSPLDRLNAIFEQAQRGIADRRAGNALTEEQAKEETAKWDSLKDFLTEVTDKEYKSIEGELSQPLAVRTKPLKIKMKTPAS